MILCQCCLFMLLWSWLFSMLWPWLVLRMCRKQSDILSVAVIMAILLLQECWFCCGRCCSWSSSFSVPGPPHSLLHVLLHVSSPPPHPTPPPPPPRPPPPWLLAGWLVCCGCVGQLVPGWMPYRNMYIDRFQVYSTNRNLLPFGWVNNVKDWCFFSTSR